MAFAKKCDICGEFYDPYNIKRNPLNTNGFMLLNIDVEGGYYENQINDCCPTCMDSIRNHINDLKRLGRIKEQ